MRENDEKALRELKKREDILVLPAEKDNSTIVMKKAEYLETPLTRWFIQGIERRQ